MANDKLGMLDVAALDAVADSMREVLMGLGLDLENENFMDTHVRWVRYLAEFRQPFDPEEILSRTFPPQPHRDEFNSLVVQSWIPYRAVCAHHLVPVLGHAHVGYIADKKAVGLSKLTRLVDGYSHESPSLQEDVCDNVVDALEKYLEPLGSVCVIQAEHSCMACRGVAQIGVTTSTASIRGQFKYRHEALQEVYRLIDLSRH